MSDITTLFDEINSDYIDWITSSTVALGELTVEVKRENLLEFCTVLRDDKRFQFNILIDVCGLDYLQYGVADWQTQSATESGFSRGSERQGQQSTKPNRFAVVYHLLSTKLNQRIRLRVNLQDENDLKVDSVESIWPAANWFEREAFDLFGIYFNGHPDLRRILTDYGFAGHPFRKDFPLIGKVEVRYDAKLKRVVQEPVSIEPRILEPKVIRDDNRYIADVSEQAKAE